MKYIFYILLGLLPSLIWLSYYLKKDKHPESNSTIIKIFIWGMLLAPLAVLSELFLIWLIDPGSGYWSLKDYLPASAFVQLALTTAFVPALVEEYLKYSIVRQKFVKTSAFDEPTDVMLFCIIAALGFAAVENLIIVSKIPFPDFGQALTVIGFRFLGATWLHVLASALAGYFLAKGLLYTQKLRRLALLGLTVAIILHTCYNYLVIVIIGEPNDSHRILYFFFILLFLIISSIFVAFCFKKLKKMQSICLRQ